MSSSQIKPKSHIEIALKSIDAFRNNGKLDRDELQGMLDIALKDGQIDEHEKRTLLSIMIQGAKAGLEPDTMALIETIKRRHGLG
jgi:uncharacterized membrane protein YebE (DUF533 family)